MIFFPFYKLLCWKEMSCSLGNFNKNYFHVAERLYFKVTIILLHFYA